MKDITEKIEVELKNNTKLWQATLDAIGESIFLIDLDYKILQCNRATLDILGKSSYSEIIGHSCWELVHGTSGPVEWCPVKRMLESGHREATIRQLNGRWVEITADPVFNDESEITGAVHIITDITQRKLAELKSIESEKRFRNIFESIPIGLHVYKLNSDGQLVFIDANPTADKILNADNKQFIGKTIEEAFPPLINTDIPERYKNIAKEGSTWKWDQVDYKDEKIQGAYEVFAFQTTPGVMVTSFHDITERIEAGKTIRESEKKYRQLIEDSLEGVWVIDENANTTLVNPSMAKILGYEVDEMIGRNLFDFTSQEDIEITKNTLERRKRGVKEEIEKEFIRKDGKKVITRLMTSPIFDNKGSYKGAIALVADITERKTAENLLKESEAKYSHLFMSSPYSIIIGDMTGKIIDCNFKEDQITGYSREDIIGKNMIDIPMFPRKYLPIVMEDFKVLLKGDIPKPNELQIVKKDGSPIWVQPTASIFKLKDKMYLQIIMQNINERKISEEKLKESEEKFRTLFEMVPASIVVLDLNGNIVLYNQKFCDLHGVKNPELLEGKNIRNFFSENDLPKLKEAMNKSLEGKLRGINHYTMLKEDGTEFLAEAISLGIKDENGKIIRLIAVAQDITERKNAEQKLKESEEKFRTIAEQSFTGILITVDNKIEYVNNALLQIFEYSNGDIANWTTDNIVQMIHPDDLQFLREYREKLRRGDPNVKPYYSYRVFTKSGKLKWVDQFSTVINYMGRPAELVTVMDITEKKVAEQELVKLNSLKSEFMRRTSHELKTPLVSIKGYSDLLLSVHKEKLDDYVLASVVEIKQGCERLESLIQDILNIAELESGKVQLKKIVDDLSFFIKLSVRELRGLARLRNHNINLTIPDKLITSFEPEQMRQVISNLINNAIKYTPPDGIIEIGSEIKDNLIIVSIKDSGIGITKEEKERLFTQFGKIERYGQGLDIISDGSGLGLYISKKIVELHGGKIWVESEGRNEGSTFYFTLPIIQETIE